jgi:hypothetical protein
MRIFRNANISEACLDVKRASSRANARRPRKSPQVFYRGFIEGKLLPASESSAADRCFTPASAAFEKGLHGKRRNQLPYVLCAALRALNVFLFR